MHISSERIGKKFNTTWIFKDLGFSFKNGNSYAITGPNGSGKSTFLQIVSGFTLPTSGSINYQNQNQIIPDDQIYRYLTIVAPYLELIEEYTLKEFLAFHFRFKKLLPGKSVDDLIVESKLEDAKNKWIKNFSTGMKQRLKLSLAFFADTPIILLDEPSTNLDSQGKDWYLEQVQNLNKEKLVIIASNQSYEHDFCNENIHLPDYK